MRARQRRIVPSVCADEAHLGAAAMLPETDCINNQLRSNGKRYVIITCTTLTEKIQQNLSSAPPPTMHSTCSASSPLPSQTAVSFSRQLSRHSQPHTHSSHARVVRYRGSRNSSRLPQVAFVYFAADHRSPRRTFQDLVPERRDCRQHAFALRNVSNFMIARTWNCEWD